MLRSLGVEALRSDVPFVHSSNRRQRGIPRPCEAWGEPPGNWVASSAHPRDKTPLPFKRQDGLVDRGPCLSRSVLAVVSRW